MSYEYQADIEASSLDMAMDSNGKTKTLFNFNIRDTPDTKSNEEKRNSKEKEDSKKDQEIALWIDRQARIFFPLSWITFMLLYFFYLAEVHKETQPINIPLQN